MILFQSILFGLIFFTQRILSKQCSVYQENIPFYFYHNNDVVANSTSFSHSLEEIEGCSTNKPWVILTHGYEQSCEVPWVLQIVKNFAKYRGGCIVCMDYSKYSTGPTMDIMFTYLTLSAQFDPIVNILKSKVKQFLDQGFDPDRGMLFGFSFGGQLVLEAGRLVNGQLAEVDACDPAGPLFYPTSYYFNSTRSNLRSGKNVQCIHTSGDYGTLRRDCDQDWMMGECGLYQPGIAVPGLFNKLVVPFFPYNHDMCPILYNSAFENDFPAVDNKCCTSQRRANVTELPVGFKMGYMQKDKGIVKGKDLFALTFHKAPFNTP